jgi:ribosomal protein S18 acetylase RimI-like enzyme
MASITLPARSKSHEHLRPLNILRDLPGVADLIELCFSNTMDNEGRSYVQQMRNAGRDDFFLKWANKMADSASLPMTGFVWEENGKIIGNSSLVPFKYRGKKIYLIANVATHPDYRRRGIARALTEAAIYHARQKKADTVWLHVRDDNPGAARLYEELGFRERARRTTWQASTDPLLPEPETDIDITTRQPRFWHQQRQWLEMLHPDELAWHRNWNWNSLEPGLWNWLYRLLVEFELQQWAALKNGNLQAVLAWAPASGRYGDSLWAAMKPDGDETALKVLLMNARRRLRHRRALTFEYPAGQAVEAIQSAGFHAQRTLIWMRLAGATS